MSLLALLLFTECIALLSTAFKPLSHFQCSHTGNLSCLWRRHPLTLHTPTCPLMPSAVILGTLMTEDPLISWSVDESCISWATFSFLISVFTDPSAQHPSELYQQLGQWTTDSWRKAIFRVEFYVRWIHDCNKSSKFKTKGAAHKFDSCSQEQQGSHNLSAGWPPDAVRCVLRLSGCNPLGTAMKQSHLYTSSRLNRDRGKEDFHLRVCTLKGGTHVQQNGDIYLFLDRRYTVFNNEVSDLGDIQSGITMLEAGMKAVVNNYVFFCFFFYEKCWSFPLFGSLCICA